MWKTLWKVTSGSYVRALHATHLLGQCHLDRVKDQSTFNLNFKEGCFSLHGENLGKTLHTESTEQ